MSAGTRSAKQSGDERLASTGLNVCGFPGRLDQLERWDGNRRVIHSRPGPQQSMAKMLCSLAMGFQVFMVTRRCCARLCLILFDTAFQRGEPTAFGRYEGLR